MVTAGLAFCSDSETKKEPAKTYPLEIRAADVSFLPEIRNTAIAFKNSAGITQDALDILKNAGCNVIRLRLWHTPATPHSGLDEVHTFATEVKNKGFKLWLTIHYSDTWADPGTQTKPALWNGLSVSNLADSVYHYSKRIVTLLQPDYVQVGNEINNGFLWPEGHLTNQTDFITLLKKGIEGVRDASAQTKVMLHFAGIEGATWFFDILNNHTIDYDIMGLSYYPRWHTKSLSLVKNTLTELNGTFNKQFVIAETAYPFTLDWADWTTNIVGLEEHLITGYPASQKGQEDYLIKLRKIVSETPGGMGLAYWAPEWVAFKGNEATDGSPWENMALFNFDFKATNGLVVFRENLPAD
jgi:arabinogalactan endo-1,4-beta-galactosidase